MAPREAPTGPKSAGAFPAPRVMVSLTLCVFRLVLAYCQNTKAAFLRINTLQQASTPWTLMRKTERVETRE